jgi:NAD(P)H-flavin reductase
VHEYEAHLYTTEEIEEIVKDFIYDKETKKDNITITYITDMIVELRKPTEQY